MTDLQNSIFKGVIVFLLIWVFVLLIKIEDQKTKLISLEIELEELEYEVEILDTKIEKSIEAITTKKEPIEIPTEEPPKQLTQRELIDEYVSEISNLYNFDKYIIHSVIWHESRYEPNAKNTTHLGLMQVSTRWHMGRAERLGVTNFYDPYGNILLGVDYLSEISNRYDDIRLVLMTYNMGDKRAKELFNNGDISNYALSVLNRAEELRTGGD